MGDEGGGHPHDEGPQAARATRYRHLPAFAKVTAGGAVGGAEADQKLGAWMLRSSGPSPRSPRSES